MEKGEVWQQEKTTDGDFHEGNKAKLLLKDFFFLKKTVTT